MHACRDILIKLMKEDTDSSKDMHKIILNHFTKTQVFNAKN
jgi:hypothetical protein